MELGYYTYNPTYFNGNAFIYRKNEIIYTSFNHFQLGNGVIIALFQGSRGSRPDLDFMVKVLEPGFKKRIRTPTHTHWVVDIIIKHINHPKETTEFVDYYMNLYDELTPFNSIEERNAYIPISINFITENFNSISEDGFYTLEYLAYLMELFILCEKRSEGAFMFLNLLSYVFAYCMGKKDYFQLISYSKRV